MPQRKVQKKKLERRNIEEAQEIYFFINIRGNGPQIINTQKFNNQLCIVNK